MHNHIYVFTKNSTKEKINSIRQTADNSGKGKKMDINLQELTGIRLDLFVIALAALVVVLIIILIVNSVKMSKLKKNYKIFLEGKDAKSLEDTLIRRLDQIDDLMESDKENKEAIQVVLDHLDATYQKVGLVKYDAFNEMGGKLSFSLALLNRKNDGFIINAMHSREGCYTYIKEIISGNSVILLSEEEKEALEEAVNYK